MAPREPQRAARTQVLQAEILGFFFHFKIEFLTDAKIAYFAGCSARHADVLVVAWTTSGAADARVVVHRLAGDRRRRWEKGVSGEGFEGRKKER